MITAAQKRTANIRIVDMCVHKCKESKRKLERSMTEAPNAYGPRIDCVCGEMWDRFVDTARVYCNNCALTTHTHTEKERKTFHS